MAHLTGVTVSMRVMSAGSGYAYLLKSVAAGDGRRRLSEPLVRYYTEKGTPPGWWLGSGVGSLASDVVAGDVVAEEQLRLLLGEGRHPVTGDPLGRAFPVFASVQDRVNDRVARLDPALTERERSEAVSAIEAEESRRGNRRAVAGYDFTFSVPKSVSVLWAISDAATQARIARAHHAAIADTVALLEREVATTRVGRAGLDGAVAQAEVTGVVATAFDHYDSRAGDPQLHTHIVVSNKVHTVRDGAWRTLDGRPLHAATVALSEHYNALLADRLTLDLGITWQARPRGRDRNPAWEIAGVPDELLTSFSSRSGKIDAETDRLIAAYVDAHGRRPSTDVVIRLRAQATLSTRPEKMVRSLAELTDDWRRRVTAVLGVDAATWARNLCGTSSTHATALRAGQVADTDVRALATQVVRAVGEKRATWTRWNLHAEASRTLMHMRFASTTDREAAVARVVDAAERFSLRLTPPEVASSPEPWRRADGTSVFRPRHGEVFTSTELLAAEHRLLDHARATTAPRANVADSPRLVRRDIHDGGALAAEQVDAITKIVTSGRTVDVLVGAAGAGKTTTMRGMRRAWEVAHGPGSVIGLAPSATAAEVLAADLGVACENTAKWLRERTAGRWPLRRGQLIIVDEASMAGTFTLDTIASHAARAGAKVLLVGDWAQLAAVDAGGAFGLLVRDRGNDVAELTGVRRFHHAWERSASLRLRRGDTAVVEMYDQRGRVVGGKLDDILDAAYTAWRNDLDAGHASIMIAETIDTVSALNARAQLDRIVAGEVLATCEVNLHDGTRASVGDLVVTRRNDRRLASGRGWVKNGDRWTVTGIGDGGSVVVRRAGHPSSSVTLPPDYVSEHVELAYAVTVHRAQGVTVDTAHAVVASPSMTREAFYVAMTRGRTRNTAYVATDQSHLEQHQKPVSEDDVTATAVLTGVLARRGAEPSAHETLRAEQERWMSIAQLAAEYETIAAEAQRGRWATLVQTCGLSPEQAVAVVNSEAFGPLAATLRRAEAHHCDVDSLLPRLVTRRGLDDAEDIAAVLHRRLIAAVPPRHTGGQRPPELIAGLIPTAVGPMDASAREALAERHRLVERRANTLAGAAIEERADWVRRLGNDPHEPRRRAAWRRAVVTVAAYRDRHGITDAHPLGSVTVPSERWRTDTAYARAALERARRLAHDATAQQPAASHESPDHPVMDRDL
ncbi:MobF family relaxase [Phytoactinopolyspora limicola]|uniref:MobF family relaxase n=1 Tax=Phytoactinopolyspora limicola TaxID=2715536 RepID=UPI001A9C8919|nr:MobF family relaxase [Phytoactinopolyspora limicola]